MELMDFSGSWQQRLIYVGGIVLVTGLILALVSLVRKSWKLALAALMLLILGPLTSIYSVKSGAWSISDCYDHKGKLMATDPKCQYP